MRRNYEGDPSVTGSSPLAPYAAPSFAVPGAAASPVGPAMPMLPAARSVPTVMGLANALKRRWVLACFLGLLAGLAAAAGLWLGAPTGKHQVKALLEVSPLTDPLRSRGGNEDNNFENFKQNQNAIIKTRSILTKVAQNSQASQQPILANSDDAVKTLEDLIKVRFDAPDVMAVTMNGDQPEQLRIILDVLTKVYIEDSGIAQRKEREKLRKMLEQASDACKQKIEAYEAFVKQMTRDGVPTGPDASGAMIARYNQQLSTSDGYVESQKKIINTYLAKERFAESALKKMETDKEPIPLIEAALDRDEKIAPLKASIEQLELNLADVRSKAVDATDANPTIAAALRDLAEAKVRMTVARDARRPILDKQYRDEQKARYIYELAESKRERVLAEDTLKAEEATRAGLTEKVDKLVKGGNKAVLNVDYLKPYVERMNQLQREIFNLEMLDKFDGRISLREAAQINLNHNMKQKMLFSAAIAAVAFVLVVLIVAYLEWRSRRVDSVDQVVNELSMRIIGTIPAFPSRASLKAGEADQNQNWRFILNESVNSTRTMLLHAAKTQSMQIIMVTSATQGEGKTSLASQLATSMATAGLRTLILDFDLRNPSMHRLFDIPLTPGASEILLSEVDVSDAVQQTTVPNLWMIPAGQCSNRVIASLAQGHPVETLFNRLRGQFDFIVVDSCPVLPVADALLIGQHVDGVVFSILQDISQLPKVMNASERLSQLNIPLLGAVVNGIKTDVHAYGYNYVKQLPA